MCYVCRKPIEGNYKHFCQVILILYLPLSLAVDLFHTLFFLSRFSIFLFIFFSCIANLNIRDHSLWSVDSMHATLGQLAPSVSSAIFGNRWVPSSPGHVNPTLWVGLGNWMLTSLLIISPLWASLFHRVCDTVALGTSHTSYCWYSFTYRLHCSIERVTVVILFVLVLFLPEHDKVFVLLHVFVNFCCYEMILK
jgi:hypothetical protein